jgi:hypothetical protein
MLESDLLDIELERNDDIELLVAIDAAELLVIESHTLPPTIGLLAGALPTPFVPCTPNSTVWPG